MAKEHRHSTLMMRAGLEEGRTAAAQQVWETWCVEEQLPWVEEQPGGLISVRSQRVVQQVVATDLEMMPLIAGQSKGMLLVEKPRLVCHDAKLELLRNYLGCRSNWTCSTPWMVVGWPETDWKLVVGEVPSWTESYHTVVEQAFLDLASAAIAEWEHMGSAVEVVVEAHRDLPTKQLQKEHMHWEAEQAQKLRKREPEVWA
jgi:hypothetical protein